MNFIMSFIYQAPLKKFKKIEVHGKNSYVRKYQSKTITLDIDYGQYSNSLKQFVDAHEYKEWVVNQWGQTPLIYTKGMRYRAIAY